MTRTRKKTLAVLMALSVVIPGAVLYLPLEDLVDFEKEKERLHKEKDNK